MHRSQLPPEELSPRHRAGGWGSPYNRGMPAHVLHRPSPGSRGPSSVAPGAGTERVVALDVGSAFLRVASPGHALIEEPSVVAVVDDAVTAAGWRAHAFERDHPDHARIEHPVCGGAPADGPAFTEMLHLVAARAGVDSATSTTVAVSMPVWLDAAQWGEVLGSVGEVLPGDQVVAVRAPVAAVTGAGPLPPDGDPRVVVDVGHHLAEAAVVVDGVAIDTRSEWTGGADAKAILAAHLVHSHDLEPNLPSLERALRLATHPMYGRVAVAGVDVRTGQPRSVAMPVAEVAFVLMPVYRQVADLVRAALGAVPAPIADAALAEGVLVTGGMSTVHGLRGHVAHEVGAPARAVDAPTRAVVDGLVRAGLRHAAR